MSTESSAKQRKDIAAGDKEKKGAKEKPKGLWATLRSLLPALAIALSIRAFLFEPFSIPSGSMLPTLQIGDYVVVTKFAYGVRVPFTNKMLWQRKIPERGDVIVFERPTPEPETLIKRVVGLPGEEVRIVDGRLVVNGAAQPRDLLEQDYRYDDYVESLRQWVGSRAVLYREHFAGEGGGEGHSHFVLLADRLARMDEGPFRVPEGHLLVFGDNRDNSADSRAFGVVPIGNVRGRADVIGFSWGKDGLRSDRILKALDGETPP